MKKRTISRILEGIFLFTLILMMYALSIFSAEGQMTKELTTPDELILFYEIEELKSSSFKNQVIDEVATPFFHNFNQNEGHPFIPDYLQNDGEIKLRKIRLPKPDMRRRKMNALQAPSFVIPIN